MSARRVWVPGGRGMLGQAVCAALARAGAEVTVTDSEVDLREGPTVLAFAARHPFSHVINCAAYTQVDACESNQATAMAVNGDGAGHVGQAAALMGATALHVSTDYVFDGAAAAPYDEGATCAPLGVYGRSKHQGEQRFLAAMGGRGHALVVRTAWLYGHGGKHFVGTMLRLMAERERLRVVADQHGCPTFCDDLAAAIVGLCGLGHEGAAPAAAGVYHFSNAGATTWHGFATRIREEGQRLGLPMRCTEVEAVDTTAYPTPAQRPAYSVLSTKKVTRALGAAPRPWQQALVAYMERLATSRPTTCP